MAYKIDFLSAEVIRQQKYMFVSESGFMIVFFFLSLLGYY